MNQHFSYRHLHYFWVVVKEGGMARAAKRLGMAVQTVSAQVRELEHSLGFALFASAGRKLELTAAGREAFSHAEAIFQLGAQLAPSVRRAATTASTRFAVGIVDALPKSVVRMILEPVVGLQGVHLQAWEYGFDDMLAALALHRLDVVLADKSAPANPNLRVFNHRLGTAPIAWYATPSLARSSRSAFPKCLNESPLLLPTPDMALRSRLERWFDLEGIRPSVVGEFADSGLMATFGAHGVSAFPAPVWSHDDLTARQGVVRLGLAEGVAEQFFAVSAERKIQNPLIQKILDQRFDDRAADDRPAPTRD
jgi:LysR family transcriptional activator of nhaA